MSESHKEVRDSMIANVMKPYDPAFPKEAPYLDVLWAPSVDGRYILGDALGADVKLTIDGNWESDEQRVGFTRGLADRLNDAVLQSFERSSAAEAATVLLRALKWDSGGLGAAAIEIVKQRDEAIRAISETDDKLLALGHVEAQRDQFAREADESRSYAVALHENLEILHEAMIGQSIEYIASPRCEIVKGLLAHDGDAKSHAAAQHRPVQWPVPQGWKLVPEKMTTGMLMAGKLGDTVAERFAAQLAAAPAPCTQQDAEDWAATPPKNHALHPSRCFNDTPGAVLCQVCGGDLNLETVQGHASDCAVNNAPALPVGPCDCGYEQTQMRRV